MFKPISSSSSSRSLKQTPAGRNLCPGKSQGCSRRSETAFALISVIGMGVFAIAIMFGLFPLVLNAIQNESGARYISELRSAAESGVDYAVSQLNESAANQLPCPIDPGAALSKVSALPALYQTNPNIAVQIQVRRLSSSDWTNVKSFSSLYSAQLDPLNATSPSYNSPIRTTVTKDYWRIVEVTARRGLFSRSVRVILEPRFDAPPAGGGPTAAGYSPYYNNGLFANSLIQTSPTAGGVLALTGGSPSNGAYPLTVQTNRQAIIGAGTTLYGNLQVSNTTAGATSSVATGPGVDGTSEVHGLLYSNSAVTGFNATPGAAPANPSNDNVLADADLSPQVTTRFSPNDVPINTSAGLQQFGTAPAQSNASAVPLPDLGTIAANNDVLAAGNYQTASLSTNGFTQPVTLGSGATNIYVTDGASQSSAVDISSATFANPGSPANLQIWYSGTRPINLNLSPGMNFNGIIYAPNASINVSGSGGFNGALSADKLNLTNTTANAALPMQILTSLGSVSNGQAGTSPAYAVAVAGSRDPLLQGYKTVTWQESNAAFVGP
jgi:hypothetical protein